MLYIEEMKNLEGGIVYGCGNWGRQCIAYMEERGIRVLACCDSNSERWGGIFEGYPIISPEELKNNKERFIIIAMEQSEEQVKRLLDMGFEVGLFYKLLEERAIYQIKNKWMVLGCDTKKMLKETLKENEKTYLVGGKKKREDFKYIFDWIPIEEECDSMEVKHCGKQKALYVYCEKDVETMREKYKKEAMEIVGAEELFCLLGEKEETDLYAFIWCLKTFYADQEEQAPCLRPFTNALINSNCELHFCCGDWAMGLGSILGERSLEELWMSDRAKVFRLSMVNRTYSFCHRKNCVHLKSNPVKKEMERLTGGVHTEPIPLYLEIGIDKTCNLYCKSCRDGVIVETGVRKERMEKAKEIIMNSFWMEKCNVLLLGGQGEVFASQIYQEIMLGFKGRRKSLSLRSNGVLFDENWFNKIKEKYEELYVIISVDAAIKETYVRLRRSHDKQAWDKLQRNLQMLSEKRKAQELKFFQINMCVQRDNYREMVDFVRMGEGLVVDKVYLTPIRNWGTFTEKEFEEVRIFDDAKKLKKEVQEELERVRALSVKPIIEIAF